MREDKELQRNISFDKDGDSLSSNKILVVGGVSYSGKKVNGKSKSTQHETDGRLSSNLTEMVDGNKNQFISVMHISEDLVEDQPEASEKEEEAKDDREPPLIIDPLWQRDNYRMLVSKVVSQ